MKKTAAAALLVTVLAGCGVDGVVWTDSYNFPHNEWNRDNRVCFEPDSSSLSTNSVRKMVVSLRYGADASAESFPIVMETESPASGSFATDTLSLNLLAAKERNASNSTLGIFEKCDTINLQTAPQPGWKVTFYPAVAEKEVTGLYSITIQLTDK